MATSGTYSFNPDLVDIITDAYQRCGVEPSKQSQFMLQSALFSVNMVLADLSNQQLNLWTVDAQIMPIIENAPVYNLPTGTIDVLEAVIRSYVRPLSGTAASSAGGTAANAFDGSTSTACTQVSTNGNISYDWGSGVTKLIDMVGVRSNNANTYTLTFEGSDDGSTWTSMLSVVATAYTAGELKWYVIPLPRLFRRFRVRETAGATLNVQEVYFATGSQPDLLLGRIGRAEYVAIANKTTTATQPSSFYVNRATPTPTITLWPAPSDDSYALFINRIRQLQDATAMVETVDIPYRFLEAFTSSLAAKLAVKYAVDRLDKLMLLAEKSVKLAQDEDRERVTVSLTPDMSGYCQ